MFRDRIIAHLSLMVACAAISSIISAQDLYAQTAATGQPQSLNALLGTADVAEGKQVSHRCAMCHTFNKGGSDGIGPNLWNIVDNVRAHSTSFNYSDELKSMHSDRWTYDALNLYIANPHKFAPGNKMPFPGLPDPKDRANLIAWLRTLSDHPAPLPPAQ